MPKMKISWKELSRVCDQARKRVSKYSPKKRAQLLKHARALVNLGRSR